MTNEREQTEPCDRQGCWTGQPGRKAANQGKEREVFLNTDLSCTREVFLPFPVFPYLLSEMEWNHAVILGVEDQQWTGDVVHAERKH